VSAAGLESRFHLEPMVSMWVAELVLLVAESVVELVLVLVLAWVVDWAGV